MLYTEFYVPDELQRLVLCAWHLRGTTDPGHIDTIYPDGCCEVIIHLKQPPRLYEPTGDWSDQTTCLFAAQQRSAIRLAPAQEMECIGVRLKPAASSALTKTPLIELRDKVVDLYTLDKDFAKRFEQHLAGQKDELFDESLWTLLAGRLGQFKPDRAIENAVNQLIDCDGVCRTGPLAKAAHMSLRTFQMRFVEAVGLSPKEFSRIIRLQATLRQLDSGTEPLAELATAAGFSDQAHANRELRRMTGLTPARLRHALQASPHEDQTIRMAAAFVRGGSQQK